MMMKRMLHFQMFARRYTSGIGSRVGFIGLGQMGHPMAYNLIKKGHELVVFDVIPEAVKAMEKLGAIVAKSPSEVAQITSTVVTMLPSSPHVKEVYLGSNGLLAGPNSNSLFIDSSTIDPMTVRNIHIETQKRQVSLIDAPVSGGVLAAENGTLTFMVGGDASSLERARPFLEKMGTQIIHCGTNGTGEIAKICNNMLLAIGMIGTSEALHLGLKLGMDPKKLSQVINSSSGRCWSSEKYNPCPGVMDNVPSSRNYEGGFASSLMLKDLNLAHKAMQSSGCEEQMAAGTLARDIYEQLVESGMGKKDFSTVFQAYRDNLFKSDSQVCESKI